MGNALGPFPLLPTYPKPPVTSNRSGMGPVAQAVFKTAAVV